MIEQLRKGAASWFAKALLALLILSFAAWGIGDMVRGRSQTAVARVGSVDIQAEEFRQEYQRQVDQLRRRFGGRLTPEQMRLFGIEEQVLQSLINTAALEQHAKDMGLALSQERIIDLVKSAPMFKGLDGKFDRLAFQSALRREGYSEQQFVRQRQAEEIRFQLQEAVGAAVAPPQVMIDILFAHRDESRSVSHFTIDPAKALKLPEPTDEQVKQVYEANKRQFVVPEQRKAAALVLTLDDVKAQIQVTDKDIETTYAAEKARYEVIERRKVQQIPFKDAATAVAAKAEIAKGTSFVEIAKAAGVSETDIDLGTVAKADMIDPKIAEAAFALPKDGVSDVVQGQFATVIVRVTEIEAGRVKPLAEVTGEIRERLQRDQAATLLQKLHDDVDKLRLEARPRAEIATAVKARLIEIAATDRLGNGPDGKPALEGSLGPQIAAAAHAQTIGRDGEGIEVENGYAWVDALATTPERQKAVEEVAADAKAIWLDQERRRALSELGAKLVDRSTKGESFETLATEVGGKVEAALGVKRFGQVPGLSPAAVSQAFVLGFGQAASTESADGKTRTVLRVEGIVPPGVPNANDLTALKRELGQQMKNDVLLAYVEALKSEYGVSQDDALRRRVIGGDSQGQ